jgi:hypothetical protein
MAPFIAVLSAPRRSGRQPSLPPDPPRDPWWRRLIDEIRWRVGL